jgi:hypothetical protein
MLYLLGFILSLILVVYSAYKLWIDRDEHEGKGTARTRSGHAAHSAGGAIVFLANGISESQKLAIMKQSLAATQSYVVA